MAEYLNLEPEVWLSIIALLLVIMLGLIIWMAIRMNKMSRRYKKMMGSMAGIVDLEKVIIELQHKTDEAHRFHESHQQSIVDIKQKLRKMKANVEIHRYNAFGSGIGQSFSIAILDEEKTGVIITGIHNREETYMYAKSLERGTSEHALSAEEKLVIDQAFAKKENEKN